MSTHNLATYDEGPVAQRPADGPLGLFWRVTDAGDERLTYFDGTAWRDIGATDLGGDVQGELGATQVVSLSAEALPVHSGRRILWGGARVVPAASSGNTISVGALTHQGADVTITVATTRASPTVRTTQRYRLASVPLADTGWRRLIPEAAVGNATTPPTVPAEVALYAREVDGVLSLRLGALAGIPAVEATVVVDAAGTPMTWAAATGTQAAATAARGFPGHLVPRENRSFAIGGEIVNDYLTNGIPPLPIEAWAGDRVHLLGLQSSLVAGTSVTFKIQKSAVGSSAKADIAGLGTTSAPLSIVPGEFVKKLELAAADVVALADGERLWLTLVAVNGTPKDLSVTLVMTRAVS